VILAGLARGRRSCGIAEDLHTAHETVRSRMWRMRSRLGARNSAHAVAIAYEAGWMDGLAPEPRSLKPLRDRDQRTLEGIAQGLTRREIAKRLGITAREVEGAIRRLCHHLSAEDRCHAVALAYQHGLLPTLPERRRQPCT
jgi:DNA-binding NarL/FixJ family response regulator